MGLKSFNLLESDYSDSLSRSIVSWLDNGFFQDGNYFNMSGEFSQVSHPNYPDSRVWGSNRKNWVWESGTVNITVDGSTASGYEINYRDGLVIFNSPQSGVISGYYSCKTIDIFDADDNKFNRGGYGALNIYTGAYREDSTQLPAIAVEIGSLNSEPTQLGSYSRDLDQGIILNVYHRNPDLVRKISQVLHDQLDSYISCFDFNRAYQSGDYPIEYDGFLINSSGTHDYLVQNHPYTKIRNNSAYIESAEIEQVQKLDNHLYHGTVRYNLEIEYFMGLSNM